MSRSSARCQSNNFEEQVSPLTGNRLRVNTSAEQFFVPETVDVAKVRDLANIDMRKIPGITDESPFWWNGYADMERAWNAFRTVQTRQDVCVAVAEMWALCSDGKQRRGTQLRAEIWLTRLWAHGVLAFPAAFPHDSKMLVPLCAFTMGPQLPWLSDFRELAGARIATDASPAWRSMLLMARSTLGVSGVGDLTAATVTTAAVAQKGVLRRWLRHLHTAHKRSHGAQRADAVYLGWGLKAFDVRSKRDKTFRWATTRDPSLEAWRSLMVAWYGSGCAKSSVLAFGDIFLAYLADNPMVSRSPEEFCRRSYTNLHPLQDYERVRGKRCETLHLNRAREFFEWFLNTHLSSVDDAERPVRSPEHWNPYVRKAQSVRLSETTREALPTRLIRELIAILTENDFAWPKSMASDWTTWRNPETDAWEKVWNPVRASAMLLKLMLPLRTFQVRMLESTESDELRYANGLWQPNPSALAVAKRRRGFLRRYVERTTGFVHTGFFINTNKTGHRLAGSVDPGYEMPWQHDRAIEVVERLERWQATYNPVSAPTDWATLHERGLIAQGMPRSGTAFFLMRDACGTYPNEPLTSTRLLPFWASLMGELERRLAARGEVMLDGSPIRLISKRHRSGAPLTPAYDLHSLRVSIITALATEGGVPIPILSKCIAGHASVLMTLYYVKMDASRITEQLTEATQKIELEEKGNFVRFLKAAAVDAESAEGRLVSNDQVGIASLGANNAASWVVGDQGICPVGGTMCHRGGPRLNGAEYTAVPGGDKNCVRCRYFITGPAFLGGLVAHFNALGIRLMSAAEHLRCDEKAIEAMEDERSDCEHSALVFSRSNALDAARHRYSKAMARVDATAHDWHATYRLVERCRAVVAGRAKPDGLNLVLAGTERDLHVALEMTTDFELMNAVCQAATVYPAEEATLANLRRARLLDALLARNAKAPVFACLSEAEALRAGNEFVNLLMARVGRATTLDLMEGRKLLEATGLTGEVNALLQRCSTEANSGDGARMPVLDVRAETGRIGDSA